MWDMIIPMLMNQPKLKNSVEQMFGQPIEHVADCFRICMDNIKKGPGLINSNEQKLALFNRIYQGGMSLGFSDWESELAAARISGYSDLDICISFRDRHRWPNTTVEKIKVLADEIMPRFIEAGKKAGLLPPDKFPDTGIPQIEIATSGGAAPWENLIRQEGADGK